MNLELEKLKNDLEIAVNNPNIDMEELTKISCKIDDCIANEYLNMEEDIEYNKKYKKFLDRADKEEIINLISKDILDKFKMDNLSKFDITMVANGIYVFCCLTVHNVSKNDILHFIVRKGWYYYELIPEEKDKMNLITDKKYAKIINTLKKKYIGILKNKMA